MTKTEDTTPFLIQIVFEGASLVTPIQVEGTLTELVATHISFDFVWWYPIQTYGMSGECHCGKCLKHTTQEGVRITVPNDNPDVVMLCKACNTYNVYDARHDPWVLKSNNLWTATGAEPPSSYEGRLNWWKLIIPT
jgi:hypothetical protein